MTVLFAKQLRATALKKNDLNSSASQPGILAPIAQHGRSLTFRLRPDTDLGATLRRLRDHFDPRSGVLGVGAPLVRKLGQELPGLREFDAIAGPGCAIPSTQQALWVMLRNDDRGNLFDYSEHLISIVADALVLDDAMDTFRYRDGRDLTGYEDGTENPRDDEAEIAALLASGAGIAGSSFVAVQRWVHDLNRFRSFPAQRRDAIIGRRIQDNEEIDDAHESAHVKRTAQESFEPPAFMVRRSMPWIRAFEQGLEFIAYGHSLDAFETMLRRMAGIEDGIVDALFSFSRPVTGGYYWCPPIANGKLDLRALGN